MNALVDANPIEIPNTPSSAISAMTASGINASSTTNCDARMYTHTMSLLNI